jgi:hypothetical protein
MVGRPTPANTPKKQAKTERFDLVARIAIELQLTINLIIAIIQSS